MHLDNAHYWIKRGIKTLPSNHKELKISSVSANVAEVVVLIHVESVGIPIWYAVAVVMVRRDLKGENTPATRMPRR